MKNRIKTSVMGDLVYYVRPGSSVQFCMTKAQWEIEKMADKLISQGADEKLLEDFKQAVYSNAYDEARRDNEY